MTTVQLDMTRRDMLDILFNLAEDEFDSSELVYETDAQILNRIIDCAIYYKDAYDCAICYDN